MEDVGYVIERGIRDELGSSVGLSLSIEQVQTLIKGAIIGPSSGLSHNSKSFAFVRKDARLERLEENSNYLWALRAADTTDPANKGIGGGAGDENRGLDVTSEEGVLAALSDKVSSITMMEREEVTPERGLLDYGLDSLISVELRNWIRRELGVEMALTQIVGAQHLRALTCHIISLRRVE